MNHHRPTAQACRLAIFVAALIALTLPGTPASAHSELVESSPEAGERLEAVPERIELEFNQVIAAAFAVVTLTSPDTDPTTLEVDVQGSTVVAQVPDSLVDASAGSWRVAYRVTSADGHPIDGQIDFEVRQSQPADPSAPSLADPAPPPGPTNGGSGDGSSWLSTVVIGLIAAGATAAALVLLRRRESE